MAEQQRCEYEGCVAPAEGYAEAQWSIVDFLRYEMCFEHGMEAMRYWDNITVEGNESSVAWTWYLEPVDWMLSSASPYGTIGGNDQSQDPTDRP